MPVYIFPRESEPGLRDGRVQLVLLPARPQTSRSRHAAVADDVFLQLAARGKHRRQDVGEARTCILRARLIVGPDALIRAVDVRFRKQDEHTRAAERIAFLIEGAEQGANGDTAAARHGLAALAGFDGWGALYRHLARKTAPGDTDDRLDRELIAWSADQSQPLQVAA